MEKHILIGIIVGSVMLSSCKKDGNTDDKNRTIFTKLDGNYTLSSATADHAYDINMDGISSTDMLTEIPNLQNSVIDIVVKKKSKIFRLSWVEQYISLASGNPQYSYNKQGVFNEFETSDDLTQIFPIKNSDQDQRFNLPNFVKNSQNDVVSIQIVKKLMTSAGKHDVVINATYIKNKGFQSIYN